VFPDSKLLQRTARAKSCLAVHSFPPPLRRARLPRKLRWLKACPSADFAVSPPRKSVRSLMSDRPVNESDNVEAVDVEAATRRLMAALDALESAVERRADADRDENELAARIQALGADRSRLADELDGSLVKSRKLERTNREIAAKLDAAIGTIRAVIEAGETQ
jgi:hypothetical protein